MYSILLFSHNGPWNMIEKLAKDIARELGVGITSVSMFDGHQVGCLDVFLLQLYAQGYSVNALVHQHEVDLLEGGGTSDKLNFKIRAALTRLKSMIEQ